MRQLLLFCTSFLLLPALVLAQQEIKKPYLATLRLQDGSREKGWLYHVNDSQLVLLKDFKGRKVKEMMKSPELWQEKTTAFTITDIQSLTTRKKGAGGKGALIGLGVGIVTGALIGFISGDDPIKPYPADDFMGFGALATSIHNAFAMTAGEKALVGAIGLGGAGALTGAVIGSLAKKKFILGGKKEKYRDLEGELRKRLIIQ